MEDNQEINARLRQLLNDLEVQPKITSLEAVMQKLEKKRKKRFFFFLLFPGLLLLGAGVFVTLLLPGPQPQALSRNNGDTEAVPPVEKNALPINKTPDDAQVGSTDSEEPAETKGHASSPDGRSSAPETHLNTNTGSSYNAGAPEDPVYGKSKNKTTMTGVSQEEALPGTEDKNDEIPLGTAEGFDTAASVAIDFMKSHSLFLPYKEPGLVEPKGDFAVTADPVAPIPVKEDKKIRFLLGVYFQPQWNQVSIQSNPRMSDIYGTASPFDFAHEYVQDRRTQKTSSINFGSYGLKAGLSIKDAWEVMIGVGLHSYVTDEKLLVKQNPVPNGPTPSSPGIYTADPNKAFALNSPLESGIYRNTFRYTNYAAEVNRLFHLGHFIKIKAGMGVALNRLRHASTVVVSSSGKYSYATRYKGNPLSMNQWMLNARLGLVENLGKHFQVHLSPTFFYSPNSMFSSDYVVKQKAYGLGLEGLLLFRF